jgi:glutamyl-tRNA synthetase
MFEALEKGMPRFGHVPVVNEPAPKPGTVYPEGVKPPNPKKKLSKREMAKFITPDIRAKLNAVGFSDEDIAKRDDLNPATVAFYREMGYLPEGVVNYLGRLGWSLDDKTEFLTLEQMIANFDFETGIGRINDSPASFDPEKLYWLAGEHMKLLPVPQKVAGCIPFLARAKLISEPVDEATRAKLEAIIIAAAERLKLFSDILPYGGPFFRRDPIYDSKGVEKRLKKPGALELLKAFAPALAKVEPFDVPTLDKLMHDFCAEKGIKIGEMVHPVRVATTGTEVGVGLFDTLAILGREEVLRRIDLALKL